MPLIAPHPALSASAVWPLSWVPGQACSGSPASSVPLTPPALSLSLQEPALCVPAQPQLQQPPGLRAQPHRAGAVHGGRGPQPGPAGQWLGPGEGGEVSLAGPSWPCSPRSSLASPAAANSPGRPSHRWYTTTSRWGGGPGALVGGREQEEGREGQVPEVLVGEPEAESRDSGVCSAGGTRDRGGGAGQGDPRPLNASPALPGPPSSTRSSSCTFRPV